MEISKFNEKFNKLEGNIYTVEEEIALTNGVYIGTLAHDNVNKDNLSIYTGSMLTGDKIINYFLSTPSETPWKYNIKILANVDKVYVSYETTGDQVEADDINKLQSEIVRTQQEVNIKADKDKVFTKEETLQKIADLINSAPQTLDTFKEIADALGNDPNFATTIINLLGNKVDEAEGKQLSTEDYTTEEKNKLAGVQENANNYIHPNSHPAIIITEDDEHMFVTKQEKAAINTSGTDSIFETAGGTGNVITLTLPTLTNGASKNFIASANNGGTETTINGKHVYKPCTTTPANFVKDKAYTIWYNLAGDCFFIKASAEGNTIASHVLAGDIYSTDNEIGAIGTMPNIGSVNKSLAVNETYTISKGYHDGTGKVTQSVKTKAEASYNPSTSAQTIPAGQFLTGAQTINPVGGNANRAQVLNGYIFSSANGIGLLGTMNNFANASMQVSNHHSPMTVVVDPNDSRMGIITLPNDVGYSGYIDNNSKIVAQLWGLIPSNIVSGACIGQYPGYGGGYMVGNATIESLGGTRTTNGLVPTSSKSTLITTGFRPKGIFVKDLNSNLFAIYSEVLGISSVMRMTTLSGGYKAYEIGYYDKILIYDTGFEISLNSLSSPAQFSFVAYK